MLSRAARSVARAAGIVSIVLAAGWLLLLASPAQAGRERLPSLANEQTARPTPEPAASIAFALGLGLVARSLRRRTQ